MQKGQGTIEYILLVASVVAVLIIFLAPGGPFHRRLDTVVNGSVNQINLMAQDFPILP